MVKWEPGSPNLSPTWELQDIIGCLPALLDCEQGLINFNFCTVLHFETLEPSVLDEIAYFPGASSTTAVLYSDTLTFPTS